MLNVIRVPNVIRVTTGIIRNGRSQGLHSYVPEMGSAIKIIVIFLDFHSTKQGLLLVDSWSRGLD